MNCRALRAVPGLDDNGRDCNPANGSPMTASFAYLSRSLYAITCALALSLPAMAQEAAADLAAAGVAVQRATEADADQYAADLVTQARQSLAQAQAAAADRRQRKQAPLLAQRAAAEADLARVLSEEAVANADLQQRRAEISQLQRSLGTEAGR